jgi:transcriptional regulator with XRE-family HTH domain
MAPVTISVYTNYRQESQKAPMEERQSHFEQGGQPVVRGSHQKSNACVDSKKDILDILDALKISMSDLAEILEVDRSIVNSWLKGKLPPEETVNCISRVASVSSYISSLKIPQLDLLIHRPIFNGDSLLYLIKSKKESKDLVDLIKPSVRRIKGIAEKENQKRNSYKKDSNNSFRSLEDALDEFTEIICDWS